jgi:hypothetical protein
VSKRRRGTGRTREPLNNEPVNTRTRQHQDQTTPGPDEEGRT